MDILILIIIISIIIMLLIIIVIIIVDIWNNHTLKYKIMTNYKYYDNIQVHKIKLVVYKIHSKVNYMMQLNYINNNKNIRYYITIVSISIIIIVKIILIIIIIYII